MRTRESSFSEKKKNGIKENDEAHKLEKLQVEE